MNTGSESKSNRTVVQDESELKGWLLVLSGRFCGKHFPLYTGKNIIGSSHFADVHLPHEALEHFHFSIRFEDEEVWLTDFDTAAGITIEDGTERVFRVKLDDETRFKSGAVDFLVKTLHPTSASVPPTQTAKPGLVE